MIQTYAICKQKKNVALFERQAVRKIGKDRELLSADSLPECLEQLGWATQELGAGHSSRSSLREAGTQLSESSPAIFLVCQQDPGIESRAEASTLLWNQVNPISIFVTESNAYIYIFF